MSRGAKVAHVKKGRQTRNHHCHWTGCTEQVPPAMWGCRKHWFDLPKDIRDRIWNAYVPGQEVRLSPSKEYLEAADAAQRWIAEHGNKRQPSSPAPRIPDAFDQIAAKTGATRARVIEEFGERAAIREFLGGMSRADAEARAMMDVVAILTPLLTRSSTAYTGGGNYVPDGDQYW